MFKVFFTTILALLSYMASSQTSYEKIMSEKIIALQSASTADEFTALSNDFVRIGDKEKTQWLPYYYAAFSTIQKGRSLMMKGQTSELDPIADDAQKSLDKAIAISGDNAENFILSKMIHSLKMMVDPMSRYMSEGALAAEALAKAKKLDPENPRITLLQAEDTYYTPAQFGGSKEEGIKLFKKALEQFNAYPPKTTLDPNWGKSETQYFIKEQP